MQDCSVRDTPLQQSDEANGSSEGHEILGDTGSEGVTTVQDVSIAKYMLDKSIITLYKEGEASIEKLESGNLGINLNTKETISSSSQLDDVGKDGPQPMLQPPLEGASVNNFGKKLLVLDVNGLLVDIVLNVSGGYHPDKTLSGKAVFKRPYCDDFLQFCFERFHVGVWSSRTKKNLDSVVEFLMGKLKSNLLFCWDQSHCTDTGYGTVQNKDKPLVLKELRKLWEKQEPDLPWNIGDYNKSNTLLLDDSPYKALCNPAYTAIFPYPYQYKDVNDNTLGPGGDLRVYLEQLASANDVQKHVEMNPFGQQPITETNLSWNFYRKVMDAGSSQVEEEANNSSSDQQRSASDDLKVMNASTLQSKEDANNSLADQHRLTPNDLEVMNASTSQAEEDDANNSSADQQRLTPNDLKVMNASTSQAEEDANNSLADQQRSTLKDRGMYSDGQLPLHALHDQGMGFDSRDAVVAMPETLPVAMPLPPDASNTIYVEGLPPDSTKREVAHIFRHFPGYRHVRLVRKESRRRGGYYPYILGFVEFVDPACAATALTAVDGYKVDLEDPYSAYLRLEFSRSALEPRVKRQCRYYDR